MSAFIPIFDTVFNYTIDDDALDYIFFKSWNKQRNNQKRKSGETYVTGKPINRRSKLGKKRLAKLYSDSIYVEFLEL